MAQQQTAQSSNPSSDSQPSQDQGYQAEPASPEELGLQSPDKGQSDHSGYTDDIAEALAAAADAVPLDVEPGESEAESAEAPSPSQPEPRMGAEPKPKETSARQPDKVSASDWARFHKEKRDFFAEQQQVKADKAEVARVQALLSNAKTDRLAALEALGYTDIKEFIEGLAEDGGRMTPERRELNELKAWRDKQEKAETDRAAALEAENQQKAIQGKLDALRTQIHSRITSEDYSNRIINLKDADEQVMLEMDRMATETGQMPDIDEAIERVEGRFTTYLEEMAANPAIQAFFSERAANRQSPSNGAPQSQRRDKMQTLGRNTPSAGLRPRDQSRSSANLDDDVEDAIRGLRNMAR